MGKFCGVLQWKMLLYLMAILAHFMYVWSFGIFVGHFDTFSRFGVLYQEKSGNPA
jgi:hypothetical protein